MTHLAHVPVLEESLFCNVGLLEVDAELKVAEHDLLNQLLAGKLHETRRIIFNGKFARANLHEVGKIQFSGEHFGWAPVSVVPLLALDNIVECVQGPARFTNLNICVIDVFVTFSDI